MHAYIICLAMITWWLPLHGATFTLVANDVTDVSTVWLSAAPRCRHAVNRAELLTKIVHKVLYACILIQTITQGHTFRAVGWQIWSQKTEYLSNERKGYKYLHWIIGVLLLTGICKLSHRGRRVHKICHEVVSWSIPWQIACNQQERWIKRFVEACTEPALPPSW